MLQAERLSRARFSILSPSFWKILHKTEGGISRNNIESVETMLEISDPCFIAGSRRIVNVSVKCNTAIKSKSPHERK